MDTFSKEQEILDAAKKNLQNSKDGSPFEISLYEELIEEYGSLLHQLKKYKSGKNVKRNYTKDGDLLNKVEFDMLTGLYSKKYLHENLEIILDKMVHKGDALSLIKIDIDFFRSYNDIYGSNAGDDCLRYLADVLKACLFRGNDFIVRYAGEEFMAVLPTTSEEGAKLVADRMLEEIYHLKIPHTGNTISGYLTVSMGIVTCDEKLPEHSSDDFFSRADEALIRARNRGRSQYAHISL